MRYSFNIHKFIYFGLFSYVAPYSLDPSFNGLFLYQNKNLYVYKIRNYLNLLYKMIYILLYGSFSKISMGIVLQKSNLFLRKYLKYLKSTFMLFFDNSNGGMTNLTSFDIVEKPSTGVKYLHQRKGFNTFDSEFFDLYKNTFHLKYNIPEIFFVLESPRFSTHRELHILSSLIFYFIDFYYKYNGSYYYLPIHIQYFLTKSIFENFFLYLQIQINKYQFKNGVFKENLFIKKKILFRYFFLHNWFGVNFLFTKYYYFFNKQYFIKKLSNILKYTLLSSLISGKNKKFFTKKLKRKLRQLRRARKWRRRWKKRKGKTWTKYYFERRYFKSHSVKFLLFNLQFFFLLLNKIFIYVFFKRFFFLKLNLRKYNLKKRVIKNKLSVGLKLNDFYGFGDDFIEKFNFLMIFFINKNYKKFINNKFFFKKYYFLSFLNKINNVYSKYKKIKKNNILKYYFFLFFYKQRNNVSAYYLKSKLKKLNLRLGVPQRIYKFSINTVNFIFFTISTAYKKFNKYKVYILFLYLFIKQKLCLMNTYLPINSCKFNRKILKNLYKYFYSQYLDLYSKNFYLEKKKTKMGNKFFSWVYVLFI